MSEAFITIKEASKILGVTPLTLRNWDKSGKLPTSRHPMSNYRIYKRDVLEQFMRDIDMGIAPMKAKPRKLVRKKLIVRSIRD